MPRRTPHSGAAPPPPNDHGSARPPARRDRRHANDPVSLGLRKLWEQVEKEPVPDAFLNLLDAIDTARNGSPAQGAVGDTPAGDDPGKGGPS